MMTKMMTKLAACAITLAIALLATPATAKSHHHETPALDGGTSRVTRISLERVESPTFEGRSFGDVGRYKKIVGRLRGEIDPRDPRNSVITDLARHPATPAAAWSIPRTTTC